MRTSLCVCELKLSCTFPLRIQLFALQMDNQALLIEALSKFVETEGCSFSPTSGGVNNIVVRAKLADGREFILRVYNNGNNAHKVEYEHLVLQLLNTKKLAFAIPCPITSRNGLVHEPVSGGFQAALFNIIPGSLPKLACPFEIGRACAELTNAFCSVHVDHSPPTPPYYDIYKVHHTISRESFVAEMKSSSCDAVRESADFAVTEVLAIEELISVLKEKNLPEQLIHGDLHYDNVLTLDGKVTGVLDFEFVAIDWRAMDLAISLSKYASESDPLPYFRAMISGYSEVITLTQTEIDALADLVILRILSNVVFFVGRAHAGEDKMTTLTSRLDAYVQRIKWLRAHKQDIVGCFPSAK